ncbi:hypothetical protein DMUE_0774 [Dictyocoela muelleri]|nr:hypothetical protein DMUE_0774 [Dictyocoela muelleri]
MNKTIDRIILENTYISLNDNYVYCSLCHKNLIINPVKGVYNIGRHLSSNEHIRKLSVSLINPSKCISTSDDNFCFQEGLIDLFIGLNIPLSKIDNPIFKNFAKKFLQIPNYSSTLYRKTSVPEFYLKKFNEAKERFRGNDFFIIFDETTDSTGRSILCVLIGICGENEMKECLLIKIVSLVDTTSSSINRDILKSLYNFLGLDFKQKISIDHIGSSSFS